ncbi:hypothetical protein KY326_03460 [Candidatus Woesearchaeota archaeon]|nr:hypothetical protein [Candidatus Woesearchaeota archaeon]
MIKGIVGLGKMGVGAGFLALIGLGGAMIYGSLGSTKEYNTDQIVAKESLTDAEQQKPEEKREIKNETKEAEFADLEKVKIYKVTLRGREAPTYLIEDLETNRRYWIRRKHGELFINGYDGIARRIFGDAKEAIEPILEEVKPYAKRAAREGLEGLKRSLDREVDPDRWID